MKSELAVIKSKTLIAKESKAFVGNAKKIARQMAARYNQKKVAHGLANTSYSKKGTIDLSRIHSYRTSDDIFITKSHTSDAISHGLVCAIDFSGSMFEVIDKVAMQFLVTSLYCKYIGIPFVMYTFTSGTYVPSHSKTAWDRDAAAYRDPSFKVIAQDKMTESEIINSYYHIIASTTGRLNKSFSRAYKRFLNENFPMGSTPLVPAAYQAYCLAKHMKDSGTQNVTIMTISDGANSDALSSNGFPNAIECPYSKRVYTINSTSNGDRRDLLLSPINRMTREAGIKTFNIFISEDVDSVFGLYRQVRPLCASHDNDDVREYFKNNYEKLEKPLSELMNDGMTKIKNLAYYNEVLFVRASLFPTIGKRRQKEVAANYDTQEELLAETIKTSAQDLKRLTLVGNTIADIMIQDFTNK